jgi:hypothetical protein
MKKSSATVEGDIGKYIQNAINDPTDENRTYFHTI